MYLRHDSLMSFGYPFSIPHFLQLTQFRKLGISLGYLTVLARTYSVTWRI